MKLSDLIHLRHPVRLQSKWSAYSTFFAGLGIFLMCVYFFGFGSIRQIERSGMFGSFWVPFLILAVFGVLMCGVRLKIALPYGVLAVLYCVYMLGYAVSASAYGPLMAVLCYILAACAILAATLGVFPGKLLSAVLFLLPVICRISAVAGDYFAAKDYVGFLPEAAALSGLLAFATFSLCIDRAKASPFKRK